jgi:hypothetical protein
MMTGCYNDAGHCNMSVGNLWHYSLAYSSSVARSGQVDSAGDPRRSR